jgi:hypothetical protein
MAKIEVSSLQGWIPLNINPIRVLTTSGRKPPLLPNIQDLHAEKDAEDGLAMARPYRRAERLAAWTTRLPHEVSSTRCCRASRNCSEPSRRTRGRGQCWSGPTTSGQYRHSCAGGTPSTSGIFTDRLAQARMQLAASFEFKARGLTPSTAGTDIFGAIARAAATMASEPNSTRHAACESVARSSLTDVHGNAIG